MTPSSFSAESYFETQPPPANLEQDISGVKEFVKRQLSLGSRVVLVTVRGTVFTRLGPITGSMFAEWWHDRPIGAQCVSSLWA